MTTATQLDREFSKTCAEIATLAREFRAIDPAMPVGLVVDLAGDVIWFKLKGHMPGPREVR